MRTLTLMLVTRIIFKYHDILNQKTQGLLKIFHVVISLKQFNTICLKIIL